MSQQKKVTVFIIIFTDRYILIKTVKIQDVAKVAGVSTATISRTLSNPSVVSEATRVAVLEAVKVTGYRVNRAARNLRTQRSNAILVLLPDMGNPFFSQILQGIESALSPAGFSMLIAETDQISACGEQLVDYFNDGRADGMVVLDGGLDPAIIEELSVMPQSRNVVCACEWFDGAAFPSVRSANRRGAKAAIQHLYDLGHRKIAHISGPVGNVLTEARRDSAVETLTSLGIPPAPEWLIKGEFNLEAGRDAAKKIVDMDDRPTGIFCASDQIAFGLISELAKSNIHVPGDIAVIGFDDIELSEHFIPALTSIRQDRFGLGRRAAEILLGRVNRTDVEDRNSIIVLDVELVERGSSVAINT
jgi:LacI family repressor for deo operon, udp, cdd, tsx, nupC, and nupG